MQKVGLKAFNVNFTEKSVEMSLAHVVVVKNIRSVVYNINS